MSDMNKTHSKSEFTEFDQRVGQAWSQHYRKQYDLAIEQFRHLLDEWPDHIDANFGLALAFKMSEQKQKAIDAFTKTRGYIESEIAKNPGGENSRYQMLLRIVDQHLATLK